MGHLLFFCFEEKKEKTGGLFLQLPLFLQKTEKIPLFVAKSTLFVRQDEQNKQENEWKTNENERKNREKREKSRKRFGLDGKFARFF